MFPHGFLKGQGSVLWSLGSWICNHFLSTVYSVLLWKQKIFPDWSFNFLGFPMFHFENNNRAFLRQWLWGSTQCLARGICIYVGSKYYPHCHHQFSLCFPVSEKSVQFYIPFILLSSFLRGRTILILISRKEFSDSSFLY